jgi:hypothetical protein
MLHYTKELAANLANKLEIEIETFNLLLWNNKERQLP